jgi:putative adenylate-forming enzyme
MLIWGVLSERYRQESSNSWTRERLLAHQCASIQAARSFAVERSPFYARFHRGLEARPLADLPILTKALLMENFDELVTDRSVRLADVDAFLEPDGEGLFANRYVVLATSGSSGLRGVFLFDPEEWLTALAAISRPMLWAGVQTDFSTRIRSAVVAATKATHYSARVGQELENQWMPSLRINAGEPLAHIVESLNQWQPEVLSTFPSVLRTLAGEQLSGRLHISPWHVSTSAEALTPDQRRVAEQAWNVRVHNTYAATEYAPIATECQHGRMHLMEDGALIEIADERGPVPPGVTGSRVLLTVFGRRTQPLIRYELGDRLRAIEGQCECGRPFQLIDAIEGRTEETLTFPSRAGGTVTLHALTFQKVLEPLPIAGWQVIQEGGVVHILLLGSREPIPPDEVARSIAAQMEESGAAPAPVEVHEVAALERGTTGKTPYVMAKGG